MKDIMTRNQVNKRPLSAVAHDDGATKFSATNNATNSFKSFTLSSFKKPRLAAPWDDSNGRQNMGFCTSGENLPVSMQSEMDIDRSDVKPCGDSAVSLSSTTPLLPYRSALLPTPEPEGAAEGCGARPLLLLSDNAGFTPPPTVPSPVTSSMVKHDAQEQLDTATAESAGARFWELLHTDGMEGYLRHFFIDVFEIHPAAGRKADSNIIAPYYRQGIMAGSIRTGEDLVVKVDNISINIAAMQVSKEFREAGSRLIYGGHTFYFRDPMNCKWWCKHIGEFNLSNMRYLIIEMDCGWPRLGSLYELCSIDQSDEELWHSFLFWFKSRHQLHTITINFDFWEDVRKTAPWDSDLQAQLDHWRERIGVVLLDYRGLKNAVIHDSYGLGLGAERSHYTMMMIQNRASVFPPVPKQKVSLAQFLAERQNLSKMKAVLEDDERRKEKQRRKEQKDQRRQNGYELLQPQEDEDENEDKDTEMGGFGA